MKTSRPTLEKKSKLGITVAVHNGVNPALFLAVRAFLEGIGAVIRNVFLRKDGVNRDSLFFSNGAEQRGDAHDIAAVIFDALQGAVDGFAGCGGSHKQQDTLFPHHRLNVVAKNDLAVRIELRGNHTNIIFAVHAVHGGAAQCIRHEAADEFTTVHADDGVDAGVVSVMLGHGFSRLLCNQAVVLDPGHVNVIIDMGMVCCKMPGDYPKRNVFILFAFDLNTSTLHGISPFKIDSKCLCGVTVSIIALLSKKSIL